LADVQVSAQGDQLRITLPGWTGILLQGE